MKIPELVNVFHVVTGYYLCRLSSQFALPVTGSLHEFGHFLARVVLPGVDRYQLTALAWGFWLRDGMLLTATACTV